jgi:hypothetical protein
VTEARSRRVHRAPDGESRDFAKAGFEMAHGRQMVQGERRYDAIHGNRWEASRRADVACDDDV